MKRILITGSGSYIGSSVKNWLEQYPELYIVDELNMIDEKWREHNFSSYNVILHVAGLAHADVNNITEVAKSMYYKVNRDLAIEVAQKAKTEGVEQFIFMSSIIVYGSSGQIGHRKRITKDTKPNPENFYGDSKLQAENGILPLSDNGFTVTVLRPPMIYGKGSKGNYQLLSKMAKKLPVFPDIQNERSMLYIGNLCEFIRLVIDVRKAGILFPQNQDYIHTSNLVKMMAQVNGKKIHMIHIFNWTLLLLSKIPGKTGTLVNKAFGNLVYSQDMSNYQDISHYQIFNLEESITLTEISEETANKNDYR